MTLAEGGVVCFILVSESKGTVFPYMEQDDMKMTIGKRRHSRGPVAPASLTLRQAPEKPGLPLLILSPDAQGSRAGVGFGTPLAQRSCRHS